MKVEDPAAFRFIINEDIYLLPQDKELESKKVVRVAENLPFNFTSKGDNKKNFLILTHYLNEEFIADAHFTALQAILGRKGYQPDDVAILNISKNQTDINTITEHFKPEKVLILGEAAVPQGMAALSLNTLQLISSYNTLLSFSFDDMMESTDNKRAFWDQMKNL